MGKLRFKAFTFISLGLANFVVSAGFVWASSNEILVRYREPQNSDHEALTLSLDSGAGNAQGFDRVNGEEGLVKLSFASPEEAQAATAELLRSGRVVSVSPNFYYRPALALRLQEAQRDLTDRLVEAFLLPLARPAGVRALGNLPDVLPAPERVAVGDDPLVQKDWALRNIGMPTAVDLADAQPVIAAVIDTGVDYTHEDLVGAMWHKPGEPLEVGYDFAHNVSKPYDVRHFDIEGCMKNAACRMGIGSGTFLTNPGHGTHCAGHVGAVANNSLGMMGIGAAAKTQVMALKFFYDVGDQNAGSGDDAAAIKAIDYAIKNGAKVVNASWGSRMARDHGERSELKNALIRAQKAGVIIVVAAGNDGVDQDQVDEPSYPAAYTDLDNLIVVAATDSGDRLGSFSNYGPTSVHIGAPGVKILSTVPGSQYADLVAKYKTKDGMVRELDWDGTSMAAPLVAGAVSLVWSKFPHEDYRQIRERILRSARKVASLEGKVATGGVLDVAAALAAVPAVR